MTTPWTPTEDDCREFAQKVRWLTGRTITLNDAGIELLALREKYETPFDREAERLTERAMTRTAQLGPGCV